MRKVYHSNQNATGIAMAVILGVGIAGSLFAIIPFSHIIAKPKSVVQLTGAKTVDLPPPVEEQAAPPPPEPEKPKETIAEVDLTEKPQKISFSTDIESIAGSGGAFSGIGGDIVKTTAASETGSDVVDMSDLEKKPEAVSQVAPVYPSDLRKAKVEGVVTLLCLVSAQGRVEEVQVENSSRTEFEKPALEAMRKWRFRPGQKDGKDVATYLRCPIAFRIAK